MIWITRIASLLGISSLKFMVIGGMILAGLATITGVGVKIYLAGKHSAELAQLKAEQEAIQRALKSDAEQARSDAAAAKADKEKVEDVLQNLTDDGPCLDAATVERLRGLIGQPE